MDFKNSPKIQQKLARNWLKNHKNWTSNLHQIPQKSTKNPLKISLKKVLKITKIRKNWTKIWIKIYQKLARNWLKFNKNWISKIHQKSNKNWQEIDSNFTTIGLAICTNNPLKIIFYRKSNQPKRIDWMIEIDWRMKFDWIKLNGG